MMTILDILGERAKRLPEQPLYVFLENGETESGFLTYRELDRRARALAAHLHTWQGERALLLYPSGLEFITAFFGCLYAGVVAVPAPPPGRNQKMSRLLSVAKDSQAKIALTTNSILADFERRWKHEPELAKLENLIATDSIDANAEGFVPQKITSESLAFLQYTSGSTGEPKGAMITHGNILHNSEYIKRAIEFDSASVSVTWLPNFHDMGLINGILQPLYSGFLGVLMPPQAFLQSPLRWLKTITHYRANHSGGPNFAYDLCVRRITPEQKESLDLSSWTSAYNGAEPVCFEILKEFVEAFSSCGFQERYFYPCYGLAESTLMVSGGKVNHEPIYCTVEAVSLEHNQIIQAKSSEGKTKTLVSCGNTWLDTQVVIVNPDSRELCLPGQVGEIWLRGASVAQGYWNSPEATKETFQAKLSGFNEGHFFRTGDLGFLKDRELFVTGRIKDVIIIRGRNYYPQDIERTVEKSHPALKANCGAAFTVEVLGEQQLVVVQEIDRTYWQRFCTNELIDNIEQAVALAHELPVDIIVLLKPGSIPKTSSGKIQRWACRQQFMDENWQDFVVKKSSPKLPIFVDSVSKSPIGSLSGVQK